MRAQTPFSVIKYRGQIAAVIGDPLDAYYVILNAEKNYVAAHCGQSCFIADFRAKLVDKTIALNVAKFQPQGLYERYRAARTVLRNTGCDVVKIARDKRAELEPRYLPARTISDGLILTVEAVEHLSRREARRFVLQSLLPTLPQLCDSLPAQATFMCPVAQGLAHGFATRSVFSGLHRPTNQRHHFWREGNADLF